MEAIRKKKINQTYSLVTHYESKAFEKYPLPPMNIYQIIEYELKSEQ